MKNEQRTLVHCLETLKFFYHISKAFMIIISVKGDQLNSTSLGVTRRNKRNQIQVFASLKQ